MSEAVKTIHWTKYMILPNEEKENYHPHKRTWWGWAKTYVYIAPFNTIEWSQELDQLQQARMKTRSQELFDLLQKREAVFKELAESDNETTKFILRAKVDTLTKHIMQLKHYLIKVKF